LLQVGSSRAATRKHTTARQNCFRRANVHLGRAKYTKYNEIQLMKLQEGKIEATGALP